jgi:hypothetical protein
MYCLNISKNIIFSNMPPIQPVLVLYWGISLQGIVIIFLRHMYWNRTARGSKRKFRTLNINPTYMRVTTRPTAPKSFYSRPPQPRSMTAFYSIHQQHNPRYSYEYGYRTAIRVGTWGIVDDLDVEGLDSGAISGTFCARFLFFVLPFGFLPSC